MSDFLDDFTIELKMYFIDASLKEVESFIDLVDASTWKKLIPEINEKADTWIVDATTNEFEFLAKWITGLKEKTTEFEDEKAFQQTLKQLKSYLLALQEKKQDSSDLAASFALGAAEQKEHLYLCCDLGQNEFVIPVQFISEVISSTPIHALPDKNRKFQGMVVFRGEALPLFDLTSFGFAPCEAVKSCFVICHWQDQRFALQMQTADKLIKMNSSNIQTFASESSLMTADFAQKFFIKDNKSVMILDIEKLVAA